MALTIVSRTMIGNLDVFGSIQGSLAGMICGRQNCSNIAVRLAETEECLKEIREGDIVLTHPGFQGGKGLVLIMDNMIYLQIKIAKPKGKESVEVFFNAIRNILQNHFLTFPQIPLSKVSIIFYEKQKLAKEINAMITKWIKKDAYSDVKRQFMRKNSILIDDELNRMAGDFLSKIDDFVVDNRCFSNVHVIDRHILNTWLLGTMAPIPRLIQAIEGN